MDVLICSDTRYACLCAQLCVGGKALSRASVPIKPMKFKMKRTFHSYWRANFIAIHTLGQKFDPGIWDGKAPTTCDQRPNNTNNINQWAVRVILVQLSTERQPDTHPYWSGFPSFLLHSLPSPPIRPPPLPPPPKTHTPLEDFLMSEYSNSAHLRIWCS